MKRLALACLAALAAMALVASVTFANETTCHSPQHVVEKLKDHENYAGHIFVKEADVPALLALNEIDPGTVIYNTAVVVLAKNGMGLLFLGYNGCIVIYIVIPPERVEQIKVKFGETAA